MPDTLTQTFAALADPTRRAIVARLARGEANVSELAEPFLGEMSLPAVTKHVQVLERAGLVEKFRDAQRRPCRLKPEALKDVAAWMEEYRQFWEESLDRLDEYLKSTAPHNKTRAKTKAKAKPKGKKRGPKQ
jgi:DNA-binding transcriptional ArsR family regulator